MVPGRRRDRNMEPASDSLISDLEEMLNLEFGEYPQGYIRRQLIQGAEDLRGQIVPESLGELLYILVRHRLTDVAGLAAHREPVGSFA